ncbi:MAG: sigma-70 family RNA polymerase sigma factor [Chitinophagales bacterium]|nr:sigma-70 family RNA polymerase sigma factor [Chitinophagales bacterium]
MLRFLRQNISQHSSDEQLLAEYMAGNTRALGILYERYMPMVYGVCLKILKDSGKAEDAVMSIYESLVKKVKEHEIGAFRGWLYVLARNHCLMEWRKNQRRPTDHIAPEDMVRYDAVEPVFEYELPQETASLERCLAELSEQQRNCVQWFYYEDKSYKEIADMMSEELGKVRSFIQNGKRNLKNCLERSTPATTP